ncbi:MAG: molybdopterin oxidoreductase family protein, partial [bacterium]
MKRNGEWDEVSWEEAIQKIAEVFMKYNGQPCAVIASPNCTNEDNYVLQKFARVALNTNHVDFYESFINHGGLKAINQIEGANSSTPSIQEISEAKCIFIVGSNSSQSHPLVAVSIRQAVRKGAKLIVVDPRKIELAALADLWLQPNPESDALLLMGVMKALFMHSSMNDLFLNTNDENVERMARLLENLDLSKVERLTSISKTQITETAATLVKHKPVVILYGTGITQHPSSTESIFTLHNLTLLLGVNHGPVRLISLLGHNNMVGANDMGAVPDYFPGHMPVEDREGRSQFEEAWQCKISEKPGLSYNEILQGIEHEQIKVLYLIGEIPSMHCLQKLDFLIVQNIFPAKIMEFAHVVLPSASFAEISGTFTNFEGRVQRVKQVIKPLYQSKPDWWITCQIARKMGVSGFNYKSSTEIMEEIAQRVPGYQMITHRRLNRKGIKRRLNGNLHKNKFILSGLDTVTLSQDKRFPLTLIIENNLFHYRAGSLVEQVMDMERIKRENVLVINFDDAEKLGITNGDLVKITCENGHAKSKVRLSDE